jgi:hypothetical protein
VGIPIWIRQREPAQRSRTYGTVSLPVSLAKILAKNSNFEV